jgi:signal transduction histidine kinase
MAVEWLQRHPRLVDWALFLFALVATVGTAAGHNVRWAGIAVAIAASLPLLVRRSHPLPTLAATVAFTAVILAAWGSYTPLPVGIALFTVADLCDRRRSLEAAVVTLAVLAVPLVARGGWSAGARFASELVGFGVAWLIGDSVRSRRLSTEALQERAERLERERETEAARAVAEEQARIGREVHDVVAHTLSVIVIQAAAARDVLASRPERASEALANIEAAGREALAELRGLLGGTRGEAPFAPQPGLGRLDELVEHVRDAALEVTVTVEGQPRALPAALDLSAYRVIQEALTNTLKHAQASRAEVRVSYRPDGLEVEVHDNGHGAGGPDGDGRGLIGMRERVSTFGGSLAAGPDPAGGFTVAARFPLGAAA